MPTSSEKPDTANSLTPSTELVEQLMKQQETKDPKLTAKQRRLLEILKRGSSKKPPSDPTN